MATTRQRTSKAKVKDPAPVDAPPDQPIPARPAPRPKDAPLTIKELRLAREGKKPARAKAAANVLREGLRLERVPDPSILVLFGAGLPGWAATMCGRTARWRRCPMALPRA